MLSTEVTMARMEWSVSQSYLFNSCPKAWSLHKKTTDESRLLARSIPLRSLVGTAVHKAIAEQISSWREGIEVSPQRAEEIGLDYISEMWSNKEKRITEFVNGTIVEDDTYSRMVDATHERIMTFFRMFWPHLSKHTYVIHETLDNFEIPDIRIWVQVDLATRDTNGEFLVSDWKTSQAHNIEADSYQMGVYGLWAHKRFERSPTRIHTQVVNLRTGQVDRRTETAGSLRETQDRLVKEVALVSAARFTNGFVAKPCLEVCVSCNFLDSCTEGSTTVMDTRSHSVGLE
jgi:hypothetical protein